MLARTLAQYFKEDIQVEVTQEDLEEHRLRFIDRREIRTVV